jgi:hypothetical protein
MTKTVEQLDAEIAELRSQQLADLVRQRESLLRRENKVPISDVAPENIRRRKRSKSKLTPSAEKLLKFFEEHGRHTRGEIISKSGMKSGTIASLLVNKELFDQDAEKKWGARQK